MNKKSIVCAALSLMLSFGIAVETVIAATPKPSSTVEATDKPDSTPKTTSDNKDSTPKPTSKATSKPDSTSKSSDADDKEITSSSSEDSKESQSASGPVEDDKNKEEQIFSDSSELPDIKYADSALLMDAKSGRILYSKNAQKKKYPASTTKILTAIIALEEGNLEDVVTASYAAIAPITSEDSHMGILIGEELTMEQLLTGMLVYSANDAANVIAIHLSGNLDAFAEKMNQKAAELGAVNTHFTNPCGVQDEDHYTTAEDLAIIAKYAMQNEKFREIVAMPKYHIDPTNKYTKDRDLTNTNLFLGTSRSSYHYYKPAIGIKTGHTSNAGYCLVAGAQNGDTELISVVMDCDNQDLKEKAYSYLDSKTLLEYGFNNYIYKTIVSSGDVISEQAVYEAKGGQKVALTASSEISALIPKDASSDITSEVQFTKGLAAPIKKGEVYGNITYRYGDTVVGTTELAASNDIEINYLLKTFHVAVKIVTSPFFFIPLILIIIILIINHMQEKKRRRKRQLRQMKRASERINGNGRIYGTTSNGEQVGSQPHRKVRTSARPGSSANKNSRYTGRDNK